MRQVAARAGVAVSSVSRVLSKHPDVSPRMRDKVLTAVADLGYEPDLLAQSLRRGATLTIGFVVGDISNPLFSEIVLGAEVALQGAGYSLLVTNSRGMSEHDVEHIRLLNQRRVDGLLLSVSNERNTATIEELSRFHAPCVVIDRELPEAHGLGAVLSDHRTGIEQAVSHLAELGHRRIGFVGGSLDVRPTRARTQALLEACAASGVEAIPRCQSFTAEFGRTASRELLDLDDAPTAIIAGGNQILTGVLRTIRDRGLEVPGQLSLVTCDHLALAEFLQPPIATIDRDTFRMGRRAAEILLEMVRFGGDPRDLLPVTFAPGASCGPAPQR